MLDPFTVKPLDRKLILDSARATKGRILTVEDHYYEGDGPGPESRALGPSVSSARRGGCRPGNPEQLGLGLLLELWNGSLEPLPNPGSP